MTLKINGLDQKSRASIRGSSNLSCTSLKNLKISEKLPPPLSIQPSHGTGYQQKIDEAKHGEGSSSSPLHHTVPSWICREALDWKTSIGWECLKTVFWMMPEKWLSVPVADWDPEPPSDWQEFLKSNLLKNICEIKVAAFVDEKMLDQKMLGVMLKNGYQNLQKLMVRCKPEARDLLAKKKRIDEWEIIRGNLEINPCLPTREFVEFLTPLIALLNGGEAHQTKQNLTIQVNFLKTLCEYPGQRLDYDIDPADNLIIYLIQLTRIKKFQLLEPILLNCAKRDTLDRFYQVFSELFSMRCSKVEALSKIRYTHHINLFKFPSSLASDDAGFFTFFHTLYREIPEILTRFKLMFKNTFCTNISKQEAAEEIIPLFDSELFDLKNKDFSSFFYSLYVSAPSILEKYNALFDQLFELNCSTCEALEKLSEIIGHQLEIPSNLSPKDVFILFNALFVAIKDFGEDKSRRSTEETGIQYQLWFTCGDAIYGFNPILESLSIYQEACSILDLLPVHTPHHQAVHKLQKKLFPTPEQETAPFLENLYKTYWFGAYRRGIKSAITDRQIDWSMQRLLTEQRKWALNCSNAVRLVEKHCRKTAPLLPFFPQQAEYAYYTLRRAKAYSLIEGLMLEVIIAHGKIPCEKAVELVASHKYFSYFPFYERHAINTYHNLQDN